MAFRFYEHVSANIKLSMECVSTNSRTQCRITLNVSSHEANELLTKLILDIFFFFYKIVKPSLRDFEKRRLSKKWFFMNFLE